ncbi:MAG: hypothetical protein H6672_16640 [Anaerolineaceae bacterium]|nr:hypothetical protein [Anaerolineaceae bacterium]
MFQAGMTTDTLRERDYLLNLPPVELLGMKLLQDAPHAGFFQADVPCETVRAVVEIIAYGDHCGDAARRVWSGAQTVRCTLEVRPHRRIIQIPRRQQGDMSSQRQLLMSCRSI